MVLAIDQDTDKQIDRRPRENHFYGLMDSRSVDIDQNLEQVGKLLMLTGEEGQNAHCGTLCISMLNNGTFRVTLSLRREPDGGPVFCKMETNQRFKQLKTVKLHTNTTYRIDVSFKPPRALHSKTAHRTNGEAQAHRPRIPGAQTRRPKPHHSANAITRRLLNTLPHRIQPIGGPPSRDKLMTWAREPSPVYYTYNESGLVETYQFAGPPRALVGNRCKHESLWHDRGRVDKSPPSLMIAGQEMEPSERFRDSTACAYSSYYNTDGLNHSKKGQREDLAIVMKATRVASSPATRGKRNNPCVEVNRDASWRNEVPLVVGGDFLIESQDIPPTRRWAPKRKRFWRYVEVQETGELSTCLQVKLYKQRDTQHCEWGSQLHCVELDCCALEGDVSVRVNKETFK
uniref:CB1 cannabinoid receptor-interacting protein 1 n=1 Tax=Timema monikensis TaxID=170555 RepID=A0A7R9HN13_9NEOP|nr:unnamed protein product [Timema monikensis]